MLTRDAELQAFRYTMRALDEVLRGGRRPRAPCQWPSLIDENLDNQGRAEKIRRVARPCWIPSGQPNRGNIDDSAKRTQSLQPTETIRRRQAHSFSAHVSCRL